jgi:hypothetical protein
LRKEKLPRKLITGINIDILMNKRTMIMINKTSLPYCRPDQRLSHLTTFLYQSLSYQPWVLNISHPYLDKKKGKRREARRGRGP